LFIFSPTQWYELYIIHTHYSVAQSLSYVRSIFTRKHASNLVKHNTISSCVRSAMGEPYIFLVFVGERQETSGKVSIQLISAPEDVHECMYG